MQREMQEDALLEANNAQKEAQRQAIHQQNQLK